jgi:hypothetical protein
MKSVVQSRQAQESTRLGAKKPSFAFSCLDVPVSTRAADSCLASTGSHRLLQAQRCRLPHRPPRRRAGLRLARQPLRLRPRTRMSTLSSRLRRSSFLRTRTLRRFASSPRRATQTARSSAFPSSTLTQRSRAGATFRSFRSPFAWATRIRRRSTRSSARPRHISATCRCRPRTRRTSRSASSSRTPRWSSGSRSSTRRCSSSSRRLA